MKKITPGLILPKLQNVWVFILNQPHIQTCFINVFILWSSYMHPLFFMKFLQLPRHISGAPTWKFQRNHCVSSLNIIVTPSGRSFPGESRFGKGSVAGTYRMMVNDLDLVGIFAQTHEWIMIFVLQHALFLKCWFIFWEGFFTKPPLPDATIIQQESQNHPYRMTACVTGEWGKSTNRPNHCHRQLQLSNACTLQPTRNAASRHT